MVVGGGYNLYYDSSSLYDPVIGFLDEATRLYKVVLACSRVPGGDYRIASAGCGEGVGIHRQTFFTTYS